MREYAKEPKGPGGLCRRSRHQATKDFLRHVADKGADSISRNNWDFISRTVAGDADLAGCVARTKRALLSQLKGGAE